MSEVTNDRLDRLENTLLASTYKNDQRFSGLDRRLDKIDGRLDQMTIQLQAMQQTMDTILDIITKRLPPSQPGSN